MTVSVNVSDYFVAGGTLRPDTPSYVTRAADEELFRQVLAGEFCYVLTPRQMGKSSLMVRTARRLAATGVHTAIIDLTAIGTDVTPDQWYFGLISRLNAQLRLGEDVQKWWAARANLSVVQRLIDFLGDVLLSVVSGRVVVFIDEIDTTLKIPFSDDFFAAIRSIYNARASNPAYQNLTIVLLGVATPADLIKDRARTPFNIGQRIDLRDFRRSDAHVLQQGLEAAYPAQGDLIFTRIFDWTGGHPYLTQKLCLAAIEAESTEWTATEVDDLVHRLFLSEAARKETNLQFIRDQLRNLKPAEQRQVLDVYRQVFLGRAVAEDERSFAQNQLKLVGLARANDGQLKVRNDVYRHVFDSSWIKETYPVDWTRRLTTVAASVGLLMLVVLAVLLLREPAGPTKEEHIENQRQIFLQTTNPTIRLNSLGEIYSHWDHQATEIARELFHRLSLEQQVALFQDSDLTEMEHYLLVVTMGTYSDFEFATMQVEEFGVVLEVMKEALRRSGTSDNQLLAAQIDFWIECRSNSLAGIYDRAVTGCTNALERITSDEVSPNPVIYVDRGWVYTSMGDANAALDSFNSALDTTEETFMYYVVTPGDYRLMGEHIFALLTEHVELQESLLHQPDQYPLLQALMENGP